MSAGSAPAIPPATARCCSGLCCRPRPAPAQFVPLYTGAATPEAAIADASTRLADLPRPFDAVVLGMGEDGHTASLFPGADNLAAALAPKNGQAVMAIRAPGAPQPRLTLTLPALLDARNLFVLFAGPAKRRAYELACSDGPLEEMPIRGVLRGAVRAGRRLPYSLRSRIMPVQERVADITERIVKRSRSDRQRYLDHIREAARRGPQRGKLSCGNLAHGFAACGADDKQDLTGDVKANIAIVSAYNDMLSAHQPFERFPALIKQAAREVGAVAQFAGGVPAMCDGVTQGQRGMELSLFSRDVVALATAVALSHDMFDAALYLGICDKIVPGLVIGALSFGHLPAIFVPGGPMPSGLPNDEKSRIRQLFAEGKVGPRGVAGGGKRLLPRPRHLHLLRHRQHQPDADGDHGPASAGRVLRQSEHAAARRADGGGAPGASPRSRRSATSSRPSAR